MALGKILIVDDEEDIRKTVNLTLTKAGYDVVEAADGEAGIQAIKSGDHPLTVDTIICDMEMPKVNGMEAVAFFRHQFPTVPVIVLTGHPNIKDANTLFKEGIVEYLTKPIQPEQLTKAVEKAAQQHELFKDKFKT